MFSCLGQHVLHAPLISPNYSQYSKKQVANFCDVFFLYFCNNKNLYLRYVYLNYLRFFAFVLLCIVLCYFVLYCVTLYCIVLLCIYSLNKKLKRYSINKYWGEKCCKNFALFYFNFTNVNFKIFRKWHETHLVAYDVITWWGNPIYIGLEIKSCSKQDIAVASLLTLHTTHTTTEAISLISK